MLHFASLVCPLYLGLVTVASCRIRICHPPLFSRPLISLLQVLQYVISFLNDTEDPLKKSTSCFEYCSVENIIWFQVFKFCFSICNEATWFLSLSTFWLSCSIVDLLPYVRSSAINNLISSIPIPLLLLVLLLLYQHHFLIIPLYPKYPIPLLHPG